jgi:hypothetical protein
MQNPARWIGSCNTQATRGERGANWLSGGQQGDWGAWVIVKKGPDYSPIPKYFEQQIP